MATETGPSLRIGELSRRVGVSPELLRAWERRYGLLEPARTEEFTFTREWIRSKVAHVSAPTADGMGTSLRINLPREYLLLHRVGVGGVGVLCQLGATVRVPDVLEESLPGFAS